MQFIKWRRASGNEIKSCNEINKPLFYRFTGNVMTFITTLRTKWKNCNIFCGRNEISELRVRLAPLNRFKPSSKIFYWAFQGGLSFVNLLCVFFCLVFAMSLCASDYIVLCGHLLEKGWPFGSRLWCLIVSLSLSHWYPGSCVVLDWIDSWSLHLFLLSK